MKSEKKMMSSFSTVNGPNQNRTGSATATKSAMFVAFLSLVVAGSVVSSHAQSARELPWASDGNYSAVQIQSSCQASDSKHAVWMTDVRNTSDAAIQLKAMGKTVQIDPNSSVQLGVVSAKNCKKALRLKLDARAAGDRDHYALDYNDGVVKAHFKTHTDWMGISTAIMAGVAAGMGQPVVLPDPPAADPGDGGDDQ